PASTVRAGHDRSFGPLHERRLESPSEPRALTRDPRYGPIAATVTASAEPPIPSARSSTLPNTSTSEPCGLCGPVPPSLVTPTISFKDTAAASPSRCSFRPLPV